MSKNGANFEARFKGAKGRVYNLPADGQRWTYLESS